jgi:hypothetical protein
MQSLPLETIPIDIPLNPWLRVLIRWLTTSPGNDAFKSRLKGSHLFCFVLSFYHLFLSVFGYIYVCSGP